MNFIYSLNGSHSNQSDVIIILKIKLSSRVNRYFTKLLVET